tara:strand:+ start:196 stop:1416 length:1221 start_codon:yes stop_codon:yes gene_type:complete
MANITPFKAVRPVRNKVQLVSSRPYYTYEKSHLKAKLETNPYSFLHVINPEFKKDHGTKPNSIERFKLVKNNYDQFKRNNLFVQESKKSFYVYKQTSSIGTFIGLIAGASVIDYENDVIKKHENTLLKREKLFKKYLDVCQFHAEPVLLSYDTPSIVKKIISKKIKERAEYEFTTTDQNNHELWIINDSTSIKEIIFAFKEIDKIYIADGHHRAASSKLYHDDHKNQQSSQFFLSMFIDFKDVNIIEFNRVVKNISPLDDSIFLQNLSTSFHIENLGAQMANPKNKKEIGLYLNGNWHLITLKNVLLNKLSYKEKLNSQIVSDFILKPILNIPDLRKDKRVEFVSGLNTNHQVIKKIEKNSNAILLKLFPHKMEEIIQIADLNQIMPPKSTWIEPKLRSGITIYEY